MSDTTDQAIAQESWDQAVATFRQWHDVTERITRDRRQGDECVSPIDQAEANALRTILTETMTEHGWTGTYIDPDVSDWDRSCYLSPLYPPITMPDFAVRTVAL